MGVAILASTGSVGVGLEKERNAPIGATNGISMQVFALSAQVVLLFGQVDIVAKFGLLVEIFAYSGTIRIDEISFRLACARGHQSCFIASCVEREFAPLSFGLELHLGGVLMAMDNDANGVLRSTQH